MPTFGIARHDVVDTARPPFLTMISDTPQSIAKALFRHCREQRIPKTPRRDHERVKRVWKDDTQRPPTPDSFTLATRIQARNTNVTGRPVRPPRVTGRPPLA